MARTRARSSLIGALLLTIALPGIAGAGARIPVNSVDDPGQPVANRVAAVENIVLATNARLGRVSTMLPNPGPPGEPTLLVDAIIAAHLAYAALANDIVAVCNGRPIVGTGAATISDADGYATDTSQTGIARQVGSIATVLTNADRRLGRIFVPPNPIYPEPGPPGAPTLAALGSLFVAVSEGDEALAEWLGVPPNPVYPPNPCVGVDG